MKLLVQVNTTNGESISDIEYAIVENSNAITECLTK
jgi:hypothetical protein